MENAKTSCDVCGRSFAAKQDLEQHRRDAHGHQQHSHAKKESVSLKISKTLIIVIALVGGIGAGIGYLALNPITPSGSVDAVQCNSMEQAAFHIHAHLDVFVDGTEDTVPAEIGITGSCLYWLHTHDPTGIIHIEAPYITTFKLGQFLDIWSNSSVAAFLPTGSPSAYVNGQKFDGDFRSIQLNSHDEIALVYGKAPGNIPSSYDFPSGL